MTVWTGSWEWNLIAYRQIRHWNAMSIKKPSSLTLLNSISWQTAINLLEPLLLGLAFLLTILPHLLCNHRNSPSSLRVGLLWTQELLLPGAVSTIKTQLKAPARLTQKIGVGQHSQQCYSSLSHTWQREYLRYIHKRISWHHSLSVSPWFIHDFIIFYQGIPYWFPWTMSHKSALTNPM